MKRIAFALVISGVLLLATWVQAPASTNRDLPMLSTADFAEIEQAVQAAAPVTRQIDEEAARLRMRLSVDTPAPTPSRDPFRFKTPTPVAVASRERGPEAVVPAAAPAAIVPSAPVVIGPTLVGITEDVVGGITTRTAVLSMGDDLAMVKIGQSFARFVVQSISATSVALVDTTSPTRSISTITIR